MVSSTINAQQHLSGYLLHPTVMDATLHLSMAALSPSKAGSAEAVTRVPAGLAALLVAPMRSCHTAFPLAAPQPAVANGSVLCSYRLLADAQGACLELADLVAKEVKALPAAKADMVQSASDAIPEAELLYETQWQAVSAAEHGLAQPAAGDLVAAISRSTRLARPAGRRAGRYGRYAELDGTTDFSGALPSKAARVMAVMEPKASMPASKAVARLLQLWQQSAAHLPGGAMHLVTASMSEPGLARSASSGCDVSAAAMWALMRVAAAEIPGVAIGGTALSATSSLIKVRMEERLLHQQS